MYGPQSNITENQPEFSQTMLGQYWLYKLSPNKLSDQPEIISKSCYGILKIIYLTEFFLDWLTALLMSSDKHNAITAKAMSLIFLLFDVASTYDVPFGISQCAQCILYGPNQCPPLCSIHLCWHWNVSIWWLHVMASFASVNGNRPYFS